MTHFELKQLRQLLFLSQAEAALEIGNVEARAWQRWEKGDRAIPDDVVEKIQMLSLTRHKLLSIEPDFNHYNYQYFDTKEAYFNASGSVSIIKWRLAQSVAASLLSERLADINIKDGTPMKLEDYIKLHYSDNKSEFAKACKVLPQQITKWINSEFIVVDHMLYSPRRSLPLSEELGDEEIAHDS